MSLKTNNNFVLTICVLALSLLCVASVLAPIRFEKKRAQREHEVMERLLLIKRAQQEYRAQHGTFAPDFGTLTKNGLLADTATIVPYSEGEHFEMEATVTTGKSGRESAQMRCGAQYQQYLKGLSENSIANLIEDANDNGRYPGVQIEM